MIDPGHPRSALVATGYRLPSLAVDAAFIAEVAVLANNLIKPRG
jgi:hypothetical protein